MLIRKAAKEELDKIYMMGYDVWSGGSSVDKYLCACQNSKKYQKGSWYILQSESGELVSSLIVYSFNSEEIGIGSLSTAPKFRHKGYASKLMTLFLSELNPN